MTTGVDKYGSTWGCELLNEYHGVPPHILRAINRYVMEGQPVGHFLRGMLTNNLRMTMSHADEENHKHIPRIYLYIYNYVPSTCHGSEEAVKAHLESCN